MGWNDLSPKEQADWKKKNYDMGINVSQGTIDDMNSRKTPEGNFDYYKKNKPNAEQREGLNRFYGTDRVNAALDGGGSKKKSGGFPTNTGTTGINIIGPDHIGPDTPPKKKKGPDGPGVTGTTPPGVIEKLPKPVPGPTPKPKGDPAGPPSNPNIPGPGNPQMPSDFNNMAPKKKGGGKKDDNGWDEKIPGALGGAAIGSLLGPVGAIAGGFIGGGGKMPHITMPRITPTEKGALIGGAVGGLPGAVTGAAIGRYGAGIKHAAGVVGHEVGEAAGSAVHGAERVVGAAGHALGAAGAAVAGGARAVGHEVGEAAGSAVHGAGRVVGAAESAAGSVAHGIGAAGSAIEHAAANGAHIVGHELSEAGHAIGSGVHNVVSGIGSALGGIFGGMSGGTTMAPRRVEPTVGSSVSNPTPTGHPVSSQFTKPMAGVPKASLPVPSYSWIPGSPNAPKK